MMEYIKPGNSILIIWYETDAIALTQLVTELKQSTHNDQIFLENSEHITKTSRPQSSYDVVLSNWLPPNKISHSDNLLEVIVKLLKPTGKALFKDKEDLSTKLKLNGFINITKKDNLYVAQKPTFEVGSRVPLKLGNASAVWKLDDTVESAWTDSNNDETIDSDQLLDDGDLKKPEKASLRVCATTGKRKACADCSCGLAEELCGEGTTAVANEQPKSSCGSCYLGDAFRCASCPYLGMPAFKPGEKVLLDLKPDV